MAADDVPRTSTGRRCAREAVEAMRARLRAVLALPGRRGRPGRRRPGGRGLQRRERRVRRRRCAPSAAWSRSCTPPAAAGSRTSPASTATARCSCRAGGAGSCSARTAARDAAAHRLRREADERGAARRVRPARPRACPARIDLTAAEVVADPYPYFAEERAPRAGGVARAVRVYLTFDHAAASAVLRDRRLGRIWRDKEPVERSSRSTCCTATR